MRYLLHQTPFHEFHSRQSYLYDIFHLYFLPGKLEGSYIPLIPMGDTGPDVLFITGHTNQVMEYLVNYINQVPEHCIVITSCMGHHFKKFTNKKEIYVPDVYQDFCLLRDGSMYGFEFDISDAELDFYNSSGSIKERICSSYDRLL